MFEVTTEQMDRILASTQASIEEQTALFEELGFDSNKYDYSEEEPVDALCAIPKYQFDTEDIQSNPLDYFDGLTDERKAEIKAGAAITETELEQYYQEEASRLAQGSGVDTFAVILTFRDGAREAYGICIDVMMGQGGNAFIDFFGFYASYSEADAARDKITEYVIV